MNKGKLTISRTSNNYKDAYISIRIDDALSVTEFLYLEISLSEFAKAVTGMGRVSCEFELFSPERVGKKRIREPRSIECPMPFTSARSALVDWLEENAQEEGWILDSYLGSRDSVRFKPGTDSVTLHYAVEKYVAPTEGECDEA